jgi:hypothetical protein
MRKKEPKPEKYIVITPSGLVFTGMFNGGYFKWSMDWSEAKPVSIGGAKTIQQETKCEIINEKDFK